MFQALALRRGLRHIRCGIVSGTSARQTAGAEDVVERSGEAGREAS